MCLRDRRDKLERGELGSDVIARKPEPQLRSLRWRVYRADGGCES
jgi:hypothetical protein